MATISNTYHIVSEVSLRPLCLSRRIDPIVITEMMLQITAAATGVVIVRSRHSEMRTTDKSDTFECNKISDVYNHFSVFIHANLYQCVIYHNYIVVDGSNGG